MYTLYRLSGCLSDWCNIKCPTLYIVTAIKKYIITSKQVISMIINYEPIGIINTPHKIKDGIPIQSIAARGTKGTITIEKKYMEGLEDLDKFSHIYLIYHFNKSVNYKLKTIPFLDDKSHGVFSTRAPERPNPIGISVVKLIRIKDNILEIENLDILDQTPLLDIKPYVPAFDIHDVEKVGWLANKTEDLNTIKSDHRFK